MTIAVSGEYGIVFDPEIKFSDKGTAWVRLRGKSTERTRDAQGNWGDGKVVFVDILVFGKLAEHVADSVTKGDSVVVLGKLEANERTDDEGKKRTDYRIIADSIGVSLRWKPIKAAQSVEEATQVVKDQLGGSPF